MQILSILLLKFKVHRSFGRDVTEVQLFWDFFYKFELKLEKSD